MVMQIRDRKALPVGGSRSGSCKALVISILVGNAVIQRCICQDRIGGLREQDGDGDE